MPIIIYKSHISLNGINALKLQLRTELKSFLIETHNLTMLQYFPIVKPHRPKYLLNNAAFGTQVKCFVFRSIAFGIWL
uniref:Uncharacterized protein n=1 Tax=Arundo donax TaxID=35708 RepID=A0A0A9DTA9_ARUDO